jgi:alpha-glucosidase
MLPESRIDNALGILLDSRRTESALAVGSRRAHGRRTVSAFPDCVLIGEIYLPIGRLVVYYGRDLNGLHLPFNFRLLITRWHARSIAKLIDDYEAALPPEVGHWVLLGNHDRPRVASSAGREEEEMPQYCAELRGTPTIYYGDESAWSRLRLRPKRRAMPASARCRAWGGRDLVKKDTPANVT